MIPGSGYIATPILIVINIVIYGLMVASGVDPFEPDGGDLISWGSNTQFYTLDGEWWRLITSCFVHIGMLHLLFNMYALAFIGLNLESIIGSIGFFVAYLLAGIAGSLGSVWWHDLTNSAGASGAIFGLLGLFALLLMTNVIPKKIRKNLLISVMVFIGYSLLFGLRGNIDNAAHIGGLAGGTLLGMIYFPGLKYPRYKTLFIGMGVLMVISIELVFFAGIPRSLAEYSRMMDRITKNETRALNYFELPDDTTKELLLSELKDHGIILWQKNLKITDSISKIPKLPNKMIIRNLALKEYFKLRVSVSQLTYQSIKLETGIFDEQIAIKYERIKEVRDLLNQ